MHISRKFLYPIAVGALVAACSETNATDPTPAAKNPQTTGTEAASAPAAAAAAAMSENSLVSINGEDITREAFSLYLQERLQLQKGAQVPPQQQSAALNEMINTYLLAQAAERDGLTQRSDVTGALTLQRNQLLARVGMANFLDGFQPDPAEVEKLYQERLATQSGTEYKARHILLEKEDDAKQVIVELDGGADFVELAKERSTGPSGPNGGDLGWFSPNQMVPAFSEAVAAMEKGSYSKEPVQTQFGWHVILLEDVRESTPATLEEMKPKLENELKQKALREYMSDLQQQADIRINESNLSRTPPSGEQGAQPAASANGEQGAQPTASSSGEQAAQPPTSASGAGAAK